MHLHACLPSREAAAQPELPLNTIAYCLSSASSTEFYGDAFDYEVEYVSDTTCHSLSSPRQDSLFLDLEYMTNIMAHWSWAKSDAVAESSSVYSDFQPCDSEFPHEESVCPRFEMNSPFRGI